MSVGKNILYTSFPFFILSGATLLMIFYFLGGVNESTPLNRGFYLHADTSNIPGAPDRTAWTLWNSCSFVDGVIKGCSKVTADYPFDPVKNFGTSQGVPSHFITHRDHYFYLSRFVWPFAIIAFIFGCLGWLVALGAAFSYAAANTVAAFSFITFFFQLLSVAMLNALCVQARRIWTRAGVSTNIGSWYLGFGWGAVFLFFFVFIFYLVVASKEKNDSFYSTSSGYGGSGRRRLRIFRRNRTQAPVKTTFDHDSQVSTAVNGV